MGNAPGQGRSALLAALLGASLLVSGCTIAVEGSATGTPRTGPAGPPSTAPSQGQAAGNQVSCSFESTPDNPAPAGKRVSLPAAEAADLGTADVNLHTSAGDILLTLDRTEAPCTVASFLSLTQQKFFDSTICHRLTDYDTPPLKVLQCGDPTGTGSGGPGYTIPDEKPTSLKPAPDTDSAGEAAVVYPAGSVAMANTGQADSGGSQFFLVYADSELPPDYTLFGTVVGASLPALNRIAVAGITPGTDPSSGDPNPQDGKPATPVEITAVTGN
jgi:peptidyl-prolyl cis-trans isomerase B (cyclophilin B)